MGNTETTAIKIGLHEVAALRWPKHVLTGDGKREVVPVPLPRLPWSATAIEVPMGASAARAVERVTRLRKIFGYAVAPVVIGIFVVLDVLLLWGRFGDLRPPGALFMVLGLVGVLLISTGLVPDAVARANGAPYVTRGHLRFSKARTDVVGQLAKLNPKVKLGPTR